MTEQETRGALAAGTRSRIIRGVVRIVVMHAAAADGERPHAAATGPLVVVPPPPPAAAAADRDARQHELITAVVTKGVGHSARSLGIGMNLALHGYWVEGG